MNDSARNSRSTVRTPAGRNITRREAFKLGGGLVGAGFLAACAPGSSGQTTQGATGPISTDISGKGKVTLEVWDFHNTGGPNTWAERLNQQFMEKYPNVTIKRTTQAFSDLQAKLPLVVSRENPPDVVAVNQGWQPMGTMVKAGELLALDEYAKAYGWTNLYPASLLQQHMFSGDGTKMGTGKLYGAPNAIAYTVGYYCNLAHLDDLGLGVPQTYSEFEHALKAAKGKGKLPIQLGNLDQVDLAVEYMTILNAYAEQGYLQNFVFGTTGKSFVSNASVGAATALRNWNEKGYLPTNFNGLASTDADRKFASGEGVFINNGSAVNTVLADGLGKDLGFFLLPPREGSDRFATGASWSNYSVTTRSKNHDVAAAYLDFCASEHAATEAASLDLVPLVAVDVDISKDSSYADILAAQQLLNKRNGFVPPLDWATPTLLDTMGSASQQLAAGRVSPEDFAAQLQQDYKSFHQKS